MKRLLLTTALICLTGTAFAEDAQHVSFKIPNGNGKYLVSQNIEIGDVPGHILRTFHTVSAIPKGAATIGGLALTEASAIGVGELTNGVGGTSTSFEVLTAENGNKIFSRCSIAARPVDGKPFATFACAITSGTGKLSGIHGAISLVSNYDPNPGGTIANTSFDIEYSLGH